MPQLWFKLKWYGERNQQKIPKNQISSVDKAIQINSDWYERGHKNEIRTIWYIMLNVLPAMLKSLYELNEEENQKIKRQIKAKQQQQQ